MKRDFNYKLFYLKSINIRVGYNKPNSHSQALHNDQKQKLLLSVTKSLLD